MRRTDQILFLGFAIPEAALLRIAATDTGLRASSSSFGWRIVEAFAANGVSTYLISAEPCSDFPHNRRIVLRRKHFVQDGLTGSTISFINITVIKHVTRFLGALRELQRCLYRWPECCIVVHGLNSALLWAALTIGHRYNVAIVVVMTDPPSTRTRYDGWFTMHYKCLDAHLIRRALRYVNGVVALAPALAADFAPGRPWIRMEGIAGENASEHQSVAEGKSNIVVYAGSLNSEYGIESLLEAVDLSEGRWQLHVYGHGTSAPAVQLAAERDRRIRYMGVVAPSTMLGIYQSASLLVNPRPASAPFAQYSFPSKLLEYLSSGTRVVSTMQDDFPPEYAEYIAVTGDSPRALAETIDREMNRSEVERTADGCRAKDYVLSHKGPRAQGRRLHEFIERVSGPNRG